MRPEVSVIARCGDWRSFQISSLGFAGLLRGPNKTSARSPPPPLPERAGGVVLGPLSVRILGAALVCAACCGCQDRFDDGRPLVLVVSGDTSGWIVPCGCASNQYGGLLRRGSFVKQVASEANVILADAGGAAHAASPYDQFKFEAILRGEQAMGIAAHNIGASEAAFGPEYLREIGSRPAAVQMVSANVRGADGELVASPWCLVETAGRRVALVGLLDPRYAAGRIRVDPPREALLAALRQIAGQYDCVVVLAYLPADALRDLAAMVPEVDVIVGGPTRQPIAPERVGPVLVASATNQGKFLVGIDVPRLRARAEWTGSIVAMSEQFADDAEQAANLLEYYDELARRDFTPDQTRLAERLPAGLPEDYRIAGTAECRKCHGEEGETWARSKHAHAWDSLRSKRAEVDPDCQRCHATGYGQPGGFASVRRTADRSQVGCESCHGPSLRHARKPVERTPFFARAKDRCVGCHDRENSPDFKYDEYWAKIRHVESAVAKANPAVPDNRKDEEDRR